MILGKPTNEITESGCSYILKKMPSIYYVPNLIDELQDVRINSGIWLKVFNLINIPVTNSVKASKSSIEITLKKQN